MKLDDSLWCGHSYIQILKFSLIQLRVTTDENSSRQYSLLLPVVPPVEHISRDPFFLFNPILC